MDEDIQNNKEALTKDNDEDKVTTDEVEIGYPDSAEEDYKAYLRVANRDDKPFGDNILSFEEFVIANYHDESSYKVPDVNKLSFVVNPGAVATGVAYGITAVAKATNNVRMARTEFKAAVDAVQSFKGEADKFVDVIKGNSDTGQGGGGSGGDGGGYTSNRAGKFSRMDVSPNPTEVRLNTGLTPNLYSPYYHDSKSNQSPLFTYHNMLNFGSMASTDKTSIFFDTVLATLFQIAAQKNISFNVNSSTVFDKTALKNYLNTVSKALQYYYFATSVIVYTDSAITKNAGMNALRAMISADNVDSLYAISRLLRGVPIPPNINNICFYLMQTYSQSSLPGASLLKIIPHTFTTVDATSPFYARNLNLSADYLVLLNEMTSTSFKDITSMLARIAPGWIMPDLMTPSPIALHDTQFLTIWSNVPNEDTRTDGVSSIVPAASDPDSNYNYALHTNELDGFVFALGSIYNTTTSAWSPSLWKQNMSTTYSTTLYSNKWTFYDAVSNGIGGFSPSANTGANLAFSRGHVYTTFTTTGAIHRPFGTQIGLNYNINSLRENCQEAYEWILNIDELANQSNRTNVTSTRDSGSSRGKGRFPRRSKGKTKD